MLDSAYSFISSRQDPVAIIRQRVTNILWYTIECYQLLLKDGPSYSKKLVAEGSAYNFEDFLKMEFVDNYLVKNKKLLTDKISALEEINFVYETVRRFIDADGTQRSDKIDIFINKIGLRDLLKYEDEYVYFVYECKRISVLSDTAAYIDDILKFTERQYSFRLPFEGMIGFIEVSNISHLVISIEVNRRLKNSSIKTNQYLSNVKLHSNFDGSYNSLHQKNSTKDEHFSIYHLLFDYAKLVMS